MSAREELSDIILDCGEYIPGSHADDYVNPYKAADAILAAGYRKARTITTIGRLPNRVGATILTATGRVMVLMPGTYATNHWQTPNSAVWWSPMVEWLPATVLHEGEAS